MRCTNCDYSLWNLTARECPECGEPFLPSEHEFVGGSVQFCCPHCKQAYYGTGDKGHLEPIEFDCVSCGRHVHMDEMFLRPAEGLKDRDTKVDELPWLERQRIGFFKGWIMTVWKSLVSPHRLMNAIPPHGAVKQAWWFMLITVFLSTLATFGLGAAFFLVLEMFMSGPGGSVPMFMTMMILGYWAAFCIVTVGYVVIWGATAHGLLLLTGSTRETIGRTYSALCFASGTIVLMAIPCLGMYIAMPWWVVAAVLMLHAAQGVSGWRATLAAVAWPVTSWLLIVGAYIAVILFAFPVMQSGMRPMRATMQTMSVQSGIMQYAGTTGEGPRHAAELIATYAVTADQFILPGSQTQLSAIPVGDTDLYALSQAAPAEVERVVAAASEAMPDNVIAHRLGDFVFTYHGIDLPSLSPKVWMFVSCADPDQNLTAPIDGTFHVGMRWSRETIPACDFDEALENQNGLRERLGLPPLPHPWEVRHDRPKAAGWQSEEEGKD